MFIARFWNIVAKETYISGCQLIDIVKHEYSNVKQSFRIINTKAELKIKMSEANSYSEWKVYAEEYDRLQGIFSLYFLLV